MILNEENYLYVDLQPLFARATAAKGSDRQDTNIESGDEAEKSTSDSVGLPTDKTKKETHLAWGDLLTSRLADNRVRGDEALVVDKFFAEYFKTVWGGGAADQLIKIGPILTKDIRHYGWNISKNPVLAFIAQQYVSTNLLETKLLNGNTFKAIHNALAKKLVAHTEFLSKRNYNLIYCKSFYKMLPADMIKLLQLQAKILVPTSSKVTIQDQKINRMVFLLLKGNKGSTASERADYQYKRGQDLKALPHTLQPDAKLLDIEAANLVANKLNKIDLAAGDENDDTDSSSTLASNKVIRDLAKQLDKKYEKQYALMQYLSFNANNSSVKKIQAFLSQERFKQISAAKVLEASQAVRKAATQLSFDATAIEELISLLNKLA